MLKARTGINVTYFTQQPFHNLLDLERSTWIFKDLYIHIMFGQSNQKEQETHSENSIRNDKTYLQIGRISLFHFLMNHNIY